MRTNIVIDDKLINLALKTTGLKTKKEVVEEALKMLLKVKKQSQLKSLRGKLNWEGDIENITEHKNYEERLRLQSAALESAANAIVITNSKGDIIWVNPSFTALTGYAYDETIGQNPRLLKSDKHEDSFYKNMWETILSGKVWSDEIVNRRKDGSLYFEEMTITPVYNEQKEITHFIAIKQDITARKKAEEERDRISAIVEATPDFVATANPNGQVLYYNQAARRMLGIAENEDILNIKISDTHPEWANKIIFEEAIPVVINQGTWRGETVLLSRDGHEIPVSQAVIAHKRPDGEIEFLSTIARDITELKKSEEQLRQSEERFRTVADFTYNWEYWQAVDKTIIYCSPSCERVTGFSSKDFYDNPKLTEEIIHPDDLIEWKNHKQEMFASDKISPIEFRIIRKDGKERWIGHSCQPVYSETGHPIGRRASNNDITQRKQVEKALAEKSQLLETFFENTLTLIALLDKDFNFIRVNQAYARTDDRDVSEFPGHNHFEFYPSDAKAIFEEVVRTKEPYQALARPFVYAGHPEREVTYWDWNLVPILNNEGEVDLLIFTLVNVTNRVRAEEGLRESEERFRNIFETANEGICIVNENEFIINVNQKFSDMVGYTINELLGKNYNILLLDFDLADNRIKIKGRKEGKKGFYEIRLKRKDGSIIWTFVSASPINDPKGTFIGSFGMFTDITERKQMVADLIAAKEKAEELNRVKSIFLANMSHELRTPFVGIMGYAELLSESLTDPDGKEMAVGILEGSKRMQDTLTKILNLSKLESDKIELIKKEIDVRELVTNIYKDFEGAARRKNFAFKVKINCEHLLIESDETLIVDMLRNLVSNAIIYTNEGGVEIIADKQVKNNKDLLIIKVADTGIGIPKDKHEIIWEPFRQASEGTSREFQGTGLGLSIAKRSAELLGGRIYLESEVGKGSVFTFELPVEKVKQSKDIIENKLKEYNKISIGTSSIIKTAREKILHVEDEKQTIDVFKRAISRKYDIDSAEDAEIALNKVEENKYDAILMDINLGGNIDGVKLTQLIREMPACKDIPIIAVTAYASKKDRVEFLSKGMSHYIAKPFELRNLLNLLDSVFAKKEKT